MAPVSIMALVLGAMINMAWITSKTRSERIRDLGPSQIDRLRGGTLDMLEEYKKTSAEVSRLREEKTRLENAMGSNNKQSDLLNKGLQDAKEFAGLTPVSGPGVKITLSDSKSEKGVFSQDVIIHDVDVLKTVNELWAAGAEAISVNDHRVVGRSSFRCVGPVIHVDNVPVASPIVIKAIGDSDALFGGLSLPMGVLSEIQQTDPAMVKIEKLKSMALPPFTGNTERKFAKAGQGSSEKSAPSGEEGGE